MAKRSADDEPQDIVPMTEEPQDDTPAEPPARPNHIAPIVITAVLAVCVIIGVVSLIKLGMLPDWALAVAIAFDVVVSGLIGVFLVRSPLPDHKVRFTVLTILAVIAMIANLGVTKVSHDVTSFGNTITATGQNTVRYDIIGLMSGPSDVSALKGTTMGELTTDPNAVAAQKMVDALVSVDYKAFPDPTTLASAITSKQVASAFIQDDYMQLYQENDPDFFASIKIIETFQLQVTTAQPTPTMPANPNGAFILYISGIDTHGPIATVSRSDVNQLMVVNPKTGKILLVNTPRDFYVQLHGTTGLKDKLTHSGIYGINMSVTTMEDLYGGIDINYWVRINFDSLIAVINAVGGITVDSPYTFTTSVDGQPMHIVQGQNTLNADQALAFARDRDDVPGGDRGRGIDQQAVITALIQKLSQPSMLLRYNSILTSVQSAIQTSMPMDTLSAMVKDQLSSPTSWSISQYSVTGSDSSQYTYSYSGQKLYVMIPDQSTVDQAEQLIKQTLAGQ